MKQMTFDQKRNCPMCNTAVRTVFGKWYQYDNGSKMMYLVCEKCSKLHDKLVKQGGKK